MRDETRMENEKGKVKEEEDRQGQEMRCNNRKGKMERKQEERKGIEYQRR